MIDLRKNTVVINDDSYRLVAKMRPYSGGIIKKPYYVEILNYNLLRTQHLHPEDLVMTTSIPGKSTRQITVGMWWFYGPRIEIIGFGKDFVHLLYNQKIE